jgi:GT2 family glycosyltransferase
MDEASLLRGLMRLANDQQIGLLAPLLSDHQQHTQESYKRHIFAREKERCPFLVPSGPLCAEFLSGAVWLARTEVLQRIGGFDEKIFLFYEDDDVCLRLRKAGYSLVLDPTMRAFHAVGNSSPRSRATDEVKQFHLTYSRIYIELKYHGVRSANTLVSEWSWRYRSKWLWATLTGSSKRHRYAARLRGCAAAKRLLIAA